MNKIGLLILLSISFLVVSCSNDSAAETSIFDVQGENGFVGTVDGTDAFIALLIGGDEGIVYVCNGDEEISEWFKGTIDDPSDISLTNSAGAQVSAQFEGDSFEGEVTLSNGDTFEFTATPNDGDNTGIYRVHGDLAAENEIVAGWILNSEGDERGLLIIASVFRTTPSFEEINDGTSNTLQISGLSVPVERFFIQSAPNSLPFINMNG